MYPNVRIILKYLHLSNNFSMCLTHKWKASSLEPLEWGIHFLYFVVATFICSKWALNNSTSTSLLIYHTDSSFSSNWLSLALPSLVSLCVIMCSQWDRMQFFPLKASCSETTKQVTSCKHEVMMVELKIVRGHERGMGKLEILFMTN